MTWSIVAKDRETGLFGLAIASRFFAVGALCPGRREVLARSARKP